MSRSRFLALEKAGRVKSPSAVEKSLRKPMPTECPAGMIRMSESRFLSQEEARRAKTRSLVREGAAKKITNTYPSITVDRILDVAEAEDGNALEYVELLYGATNESEQPHNSESVETMTDDVEITVNTDLKDRAIGKVDRLHVKTQKECQCTIKPTIRNVKVCVPVRQERSYTSLGFTTPYGEKIVEPSFRSVGCGETSVPTEKRECFPEGQSVGRSDVYGVNGKRIKSAAKPVLTSVSCGDEKNDPKKTRLQACR